MTKRSGYSIGGGLFILLLSVFGSAQSAELREQIYDRNSEYSKLDIDGDGFVSVDEYNGTTQLFDAMDSNGDGKIGPDEATYLITFVDIPSGSFTMGTEGKEPSVTPMRDAVPVHRVAIDGFRMASTEVTTAQYAEYLNSALRAGQITVARANSGPGRIVYPLPIWTIYGAQGAKYEDQAYASLSPVSGLSHVKADGHPLLIPEHPLNQSWISYIPELERFTVAVGFEDWPVPFIKWYGAMAFADYYGLSLPTEAEWEYVARGGEQFRFATSDGKAGCDRANYKCYNGQRRDVYAGLDTPEEYMGHRVNVGSFAANPFGIFDLGGNVWEWCLDWYAKDFYQQSVDSGIVRNPANLVGTESAADIEFSGSGQRDDAGISKRVTRGGSYQYHETTTETAARRSMPAFRGNDHWGFRVIYRPSSTVFNLKE